MSGRQAAVGLALALGLAAPVALADDDHAVSRGGGSSSSSAGAGHHSGGGAHSSDAGGSSGGSGGSSSDDRTLTGAQLRHPRAGTGTGWHHGRGGVVYYGSPYYGSAYLYPWYGAYYGSGYGYWGYSPYYYSGYYGYSPSYYGRSRAGALRVLVEPNETRVYVDGYYAGIADDFDGIFQRLYLSPGRHEISLRLEGYRTQNLKVYVPYDQTLKIHHRMVPGAPGEVSEDVVGGPEDVRDDRNRYGRYEGDEREDRDDEAAEEDLGAGNVRGERGTLRLNVRPADASVYVDGAFRGTGRLRTLSLPVGRHRVEVVRPGYRTAEREVEVRPGQEAEVEVDLDRS